MLIATNNTYLAVFFILPLLSIKKPNHLSIGNSAL